MTKIIPGVLVLFKRLNSYGEAEYALHLRRSGFHKGYYHAPGGHCEGESFGKTAKREMLEELGVQLLRTKQAHLLRRKAYVIRKVKGKEVFEPVDEIRPDMVIVVSQWQGKFKNKEPKKHGPLKWFNENNLPKNTVPYVKQAVEMIKCGIKRSKHGFE